MKKITLFILITAISMNLFGQELSTNQAANINDLIKPGAWFIDFTPPGTTVGGQAADAAADQLSNGNSRAGKLLGRAMKEVRKVRDNAGAPAAAGGTVGKPNPAQSVAIDLKVIPSGYTDGAGNAIPYLELTNNDGNKSWLIPDNIYCPIGYIRVDERVKGVPHTPQPRAKGANGEDVTGNFNPYIILNSGRIERIDLTNDDPWVALADHAEYDLRLDKYPVNTTTQLDFGYFCFTKPGETATPYADINGYLAAQGYGADKSHKNKGKAWDAMKDLYVAMHQQQQKEIADAKARGYYALMDEVLKEGQVYHLKGNNASIRLKAQYRDGALFTESEYEPGVFNTQFAPVEKRDGLYYLSPNMILAPYHNSIMIIQLSARNSFTTASAVFSADGLDPILNAFHHDHTSPHSFIFTAGHSKEALYFAQKEVGTDIETDFGKFYVEFLNAATGKRFSYGF